MAEVLPRLHAALLPRRVPNLVHAVLARPRLLLWLEIGLVLYLTMFLAATPAAAAPPNPLEALNRTDSAGYQVSNYNIEYLIDLLNTQVAGQSMTAWWVKLIWDLYRYGVGAAALLIDLTVGFGWLDYLIYPVEQTAEVLDKLLDELPLVRELLITLAIGVGIARMWIGQQARGLTDMLGSMTAWGISAAIVTNPVTWLTGPSGILTRTKEGGQQFSAQLVNPDAAAGDASSSEAAGSMAEQIVTIFVRKPHQFIAYGGLADGGGCEQTYNENLTKSGKDLANAMLKCSPDFGETIKNPSSVTLVTALIILLGAAVLIGIAVVCSGIIIYEVINMLIAGVQGVWELFRAVGPGGSYRGLLGIAINVLESILGLMAVIMLSALYLAVVQYFFTEWEEDMIVLFLIVDVVLIVVIAVIFRQRAKMRKAFERMKERTQARAQNVPVPKRLTAAAHGRGGFTAGIATTAGSRVAHTAGRAGSRLAHATATAGRSAGNLATSPARAASRHVSRPGFMAARLGSGMLHKAGIHGKASHGLIRGIAHNRGEKAWRNKEAKREQKREQRTERRQRAQHWTWAGATRDADARAAGHEQVGATAAEKGRKGRPQRRANQSPAPAPEQKASRRRGAAPASRRPHSETPATARTANPGPAPANHRSRTQSPQTRADSRPTTGTSRARGPQQPVTVPGRERGSAPSAKDRLNTKMRARRGASATPRPRTSSRTLRKAQTARKNAA